MKNMFLKKYWFYALTALLLVLFCYFRVKPILLQTFPYTFDQGRDFLKTERIVREHHLAFYGPPAGGAGGMSHGVWWYYELLIPYVLSGGLPEGFSYFIFSVMLVSTFAYMWFLQREFNRLSAIFFLLLTTFSPYAIFSSFFPINSVMTIPFILLFSMSFYYFIKTRNPRYALLFALSAGFIFEAEVSFGILLFPSILATLFMTRNYPKFIKSRQVLKYVCVGLTIPFAPRVLLEIATQFLQTRGLIFGLLNTSEPVKPGDNVMLERLNLFKNYYYSLFPTYAIELTISSLILIVVAFMLVIRMKKSAHRSHFSFSFFIPLMLFFASLLSTKHSFWANYLEGIQYFFIILITAGFYVLNTSKIKIFRIVSYASLFILIFILGQTVQSEILSKKPIQMEGLRRHLKTLDAIYQLSENKRPCIRIYTPPVIPHTYFYLFGVYTRRGLPTPTTEFTNKRCYYIMERDEYQFRPDEWRKNNIPQGATQLRSVTINPDVTIEVWQENQKSL
jgi:hypothetical protein